MQVSGRANLVPIAVPGICLQTFLLNSKQWFLRTNSSIEMISSVGTLQMPISLSLFLKDCKPKLQGILGWSRTTAAVTSVAPSGILPKRLIF